MTTTRSRSAALATISPAWESALFGYELAGQARNLHPRTLANRRSSISGLARWLEAEHGVTSPEQVTKLHMQLAMKRAYGDRDKSGVRTYYNDQKAFWDWHAAEEQVPSPLAGITRPKDVVVPVQVLTDKEIQRLLATVAGRDWRSTRDKSLFLMLLETGMRREELVQLDVSDVDLKQRLAVIRNGKGGRARVAVFGPETASALNRMLAKHSGTGPLFTSSPNGRRLLGNSVGALLWRLGTQANVYDLHAHRFRHTWVHLNLASGLQEHEAMVLAGWTTTNQLSRYGAAMAAQRAQAAAHARPVMQLVKAG